VAFTAAVLCEPEAASEPVHPPEAVQAVALVELQVNIEVPAGAITDGDTDSVAVGTTFTVAVAGALIPPAPVQTRV
jgi:hypothetical protein